jgi:hypothetical protein
MLHPKCPVGCSLGCILLFRNPESGAGTPIFQIAAAGFQIPRKNPGTGMRARAQPSLFRIFFKRQRAISEIPAGAPYGHYVNLAQRDVQVAHRRMKNLLKDFRASIR